MSESMLDRHSRTFEDQVLIERFLDWAQGEFGYQLAGWATHVDYLEPALENNSFLIAEFFDIDQVQLDKERVELLDELRELNRGERAG